MQKTELPRSIGVLGGAAIMVGVMIGSGIFRTPTSIAGALSNPYLILGLWVAGGGLCLLGALTYAELATMYPKAGGVYVFLHKGFGPRVAFVFGWTYFLIIQPMAVAGIAIVFAEHLNMLLDKAIDPRITNCVVIVLLAGINVTGMKRGAGIAVALTSFKTIALAAIVVVSLVMMKGDTANFATTAAPTGSFFAALLPVLAAILWTYDGWSDIGAVAEEVTEPQRKIPQIFLLGTAGITLLYLAVNAVYLWMIPLEEMRKTETVAPLIMERLLGNTGSVAVTVLIMISVLGSTHASIIVGSRVTFAQARDRLLFRKLAKVHPKFETPSTALWVLCVMSCAATLVLANFERLMAGFVNTMWVFYGLAAAAIFILRVKQPDTPRPYRCWGYPVVPALFIACSVFMTILAVTEDSTAGKDMLVCIGIMVAGIPAYSLWKRLDRTMDDPTDKESTEEDLLCESCGYNLTGNQSGTCPECGTPISDD